MSCIFSIVLKCSKGSKENGQDYCWQSRTCILACDASFSMSFCRIFSKNQPLLFIRFVSSRMKHPFWKWTFAMIFTLIDQWNVKMRSDIEWANYCIWILFHLNHLHPQTINRYSGWHSFQLAYLRQALTNRVRTKSSQTLQRFSFCVFSPNLAESSMLPNVPCVLSFFYFWCFHGFRLSMFMDVSFLISFADFSISF